MEPLPLDAPALDLVGALRARASESDPDRLTRTLYGELRRLAHGHRVRWHGDATINTTALVHEAYLKVTGTEAFEGRGHFLGVASRAMRHVLVNYARDRSALKRGGGARPVSLDDAPEAALLSPAQTNDVLGLDGALSRLGAFDARAARVVELRFFGGLTLDEVADVLGVSPATVTRDWRRARAWLRGELGRVPIALPAPS